MEAFPGRFISEILAEVDRLPAGLLHHTLEAKAYRQAKGMTDAADTKEAVDRLPKTPMFRLVQQIERELVQEDIDRRNRNE